MTNSLAAPAQAALAPELTIGPVLYHWRRDTLTQFYADIAESAAENVVLGEVVCARRVELRLSDWLDLARDLKQAGKRVWLASQALMESEADLRQLRRMVDLCAEQGMEIEASDASALAVMEGRSFSLSPHINVYSREALQWHAALGASRWVPPVELSLAQVQGVQPLVRPVMAGGGDTADVVGGAAPVAVEMFAFGRMPLAFSARCFTARHHRLNKDECEFRCMDDDDGLLVRSTEGQDFLVFNGIQTQSAGLQCLLARGDWWRAQGVSALRLSPCAKVFGEVLRIHDALRRDALSADEALSQMQRLALPGPLVQGYALGHEGLQPLARPLSTELEVVC